MTKRLILVVALAASAGCSLEIKQLQRPYDKRTQPRCEPEDAAPVGDILAGAAFILLGIAIIAVGENADGESTTDRVVAGLGIAGGGAIWGGVGLAGMGWNRECYEAREQWDIRQIEQDEHLRGNPSAAAPPARNPKNDPARAATYWCGARGCFADRINCKGDCLKQKSVWCAVDDDRFFRCAVDRHDCLVAKHKSRERVGECVEQTAAAVEPVATPTAPVPPMPRGFYCTGSPNSPTVGTCSRERADCETARGALIVAAPDVTNCSLTETAWCYRDGQRCAPSGVACSAQRDAELAANSDSTLAECVGVK